jgi:cytochrome P450
MDVLASITAFPISFGILAVAVYLGFLATSRLLFSPIAKFPGPKLAALTHWYEFYYEIILKGQFTFKIRELHSKYGPIVRINPHELHVSDPDFYERLYAGGRKRREKWQWHTRGLGLNDSMLATVDHDLHRRRRMAVSGFFSTQSARRLQPLIHERVETLVGRLRASTDSGKVIPMNFAYAAFSNGM